MLAPRVLPAEAEPAHAVDDGVDVFLLFLLRVGVVEAQVAAAVVIARQAEVQADRFGVADVQIAVRLRREARAYLGRVGLATCLLRGIAWRTAPAAAGVGALFDVALDNVADEVAVPVATAPGAALCLRSGAIPRGRGRAAPGQRAPEEPLRVAQRRRRQRPPLDAALSMDDVVSVCADGDTFTMQRSFVLNRRSPQMLLTAGAGENVPPRRLVDRHQRAVGHRRWLVRRPTTRHCRTTRTVLLCAAGPYAAPAYHPPRVVSRCVATSGVATASPLPRLPWNSGATNRCNHDRGTARPPAPSRSAGASRISPPEWRGCTGRQVKRLAARIRRCGGRA